MGIRGLVGMLTSANEAARDRNRLQELLLAHARVLQRARQADLVDQPVDGAKSVAGVVVGAPAEDE